MAYAFRIDGGSASNGTVRIQHTDGQTPLPAEASGEGLMMSVSALDELVDKVKSQREKIAFAALLLRADAIDPTHGVAFRQALVGKRVTLDPTSDNIMVRS